MLRFNPRYFIFAIILFVIEVLIALFVHDSFIRPYFGDYLVVILMYCFVRAFLNVPVLPLAAGVLVFAYLIEVLQYFRVVDRLGLGGNKLAETVIGVGFEWWDMLAYTLGVATVIFLENIKIRRIFI